MSSLVCGTNSISMVQLTPADTRPGSRVRGGEGRVIIESSRGRKYSQTGAQTRGRDKVCVTRQEIETGDEEQVVPTGVQ